MTTIWKEKGRGRRGETERVRDHNIRGKKQGKTDYKRKHKTELSSAVLHLAYKKALHGLLMNLESNSILITTRNVGPSLAVNVDITITCSPWLALNRWHQWSQYMNIKPWLAHNPPTNLHTIVCSYGTANNAEYKRQSYQSFKYVDQYMISLLDRSIPILLESIRTEFCISFWTTRFVHQVKKLGMKSVTPTMQNYSLALQVFSNLQCICMQSLWAALQL